MQDLGKNETFNHTYNMSIHILKDYLKENPNTRYIDAFYSDLSGIIRGKRFPINSADKIFKTGVMVPGSCFLLSAIGESFDPCGLGFTDGDPDENAITLVDTLVPMPWAQIPTAQVQLTLQSQNGDPYYYEPRNVLKRVIKSFESLKLTPVVAFELEFYLFDLCRDDNHQLRPPTTPLSRQRNYDTQVYSLAEIEDYALFIDEVICSCELQNIKAGAITTEYAPGQFEINLEHLNDPLKAADQAAMFKRLVRGVARKHAMQASFMSKPYLDNAGSGLHIHISLVDEHGNNVFDGGGDYDSDNFMSDTLAEAIGGLLETLPDSMLIFAANTNAYRRYVPNIFVPTTPSWGKENRSVAIRIPRSTGAARRIEHRVAGADANPYLLLATVLAGIHYGITEKSQPGDQAYGNASNKLSAQIPFDIESGIKKIKQSEILKDYLGKKYIDTYAECKRLEYQAFKDRKIEDESCWYL